MVNKKTRRRSAHTITFHTMKKEFSTVFQMLTILTMFALAVTISGCSGGGGGSSSGGGGGGDSAAVSRYTMPSEISAVPTNEDAEGDSAKYTFSASLRGIVKALTDANTDYSKATTRKYVEEHSLQQFDMLSEALSAIAETQYMEEVGEGPYTAMVVMEGKESGQSTKELQKWVVQSDAVEVDGETVLRVRAWIEENHDGETEVIKAEFTVTTPPTQRADGSYEDYGEWTLMVQFGKSEDNYFAASCEQGDSGTSIIKVHEKMMDFGPGGGSEGEESTMANSGPEAMAILYRGDTSGYGKVYYPNYEDFYCFECNQSGGIPHTTAIYAYNEDYLGILDDFDATAGYDAQSGDAVYKNRGSVVEMTHQYGVFNATTGEDIMKSKNFGFPLRYTDGSGFEMHGYYGAWQGRHQLWGGDQSIAEDTIVTREVFGPDQDEADAETYKVGPTFNGVLVKRTMVPADPSDIQNIPVEIWVDNNYEMVYDSGAWQYCTQMNWGEIPATEAGTEDLSSGAAIGGLDFDVSTKNSGGTTTITISAGTYNDRDSVRNAINTQLSMNGFWSLQAVDNGNSIDITQYSWSGDNFTIAEGTADGFLGIMGWDAGTYQAPMCKVDLINFETTVGLDSLIVADNDHRKHVNINGYDPNAGTYGECKDYLYREVDGTKNFYEAEYVEGDYGMQLTLKSPTTAIDTTAISQLNVWIGGSIWVAYTGTGSTGWVEKEISYFNEQYWKPEFNDDGDKDYILPEGRELYINMEGANYIVTRSGEDLTVKYELQTACNPENATTVVPAGTEFTEQWNSNMSSTYERQTKPARDDYLMLVYKTIGDNDKEWDEGSQTYIARDGIAVGDIISNVWGITATIGGVETQFNWEYNANGGWGAVTYLMEGNDTDGWEYVLLSDPVRFDSITATNGAGDTKTLSLQYDGWMMGLPDMYMDLQKNNWVMTEDMANKVINIVAGTEVTDSSTDPATVYVLKPREISQFLSVVTDTTGLTLPNIALGADVSLSTVPVFVDHGMGAMPTDTEIKYSEGIAVTE